MSLTTIKISMIYKLNDTILTTLYSRKVLDGIYNN